MSFCQLKKLVCFCFLFFVFQVLLSGFLWFCVSFLFLFVKFEFFIYICFFFFLIHLDSAEINMVKEINA